MTAFTDRHRTDDPPTECVECGVTYPAAAWGSHLERCPGPLPVEAVARRILEGRTVPAGDLARLARDYLAMCGIRVTT